MLDEAVEGPASIDFIKIVVEGYELDILEGGKEVIAKYKPTLFIEDKNMEDEDIADFMDAMGYKLAEDDLQSYIWVYDE